MERLILGFILGFILHDFLVKKAGERGMDIEQARVNAANWLTVNFPELSQSEIGQYANEIISGQ